MAGASLVSRDFEKARRCGCVWSPLVTTEITGTVREESEEDSHTTNYLTEAQRERVYAKHYFNYYAMFIPTTAL